MSHEEEIQVKLQFEVAMPCSSWGPLCHCVRLVSLLFVVKTRTPTATGPLVSLACFDLSEQRVGLKLYVED